MTLRASCKDAPESSKMAANIRALVFRDEAEALFACSQSTDRPSHARRNCCRSAETGSLATAEVQPIKLPGIEIRRRGESTTTAVCYRNTKASDRTRGGEARNLAHARCLDNGERSNALMHVILKMASNTIVVSLFSNPLRRTGFKKELQISIR